MRRKIILLIFVCTVLLVSCSSQRTFMDEDLLIQLSDIPPGWEVVELGTENDYEEGQDSQAYTSFDSEKIDTVNRMGMSVYRYSASFWAAFHYKRMLPLWSGYSAYYDSEYFVPEEIKFASTYADKWSFACIHASFKIRPISGSEGIVCAYLAQYDEFIVRMVFPNTVDGVEVISLAEIEDILQIVDERVGNYLE